MRFRRVLRRAFFVPPPESESGTCVIIDDPVRQHLQRCEECGVLWDPLPDRPGQCRRCGNRTVSAVAWGCADADPIADIRAMAASYHQATGRAVDAFVGLGDVVVEVVIDSEGQSWPVVGLDHHGGLTQDMRPHDYTPDGCWATSLLYEADDPEAEACNEASVDALGLCAEHRRRMVGDGL